MSTVSGISGSSALSWLRNLQASSSTSSASSADPTSSAESTSATQSTGHHRHHGGGGGFQAKFDSALSDQGITGTKLSDLRTQIQDAVKKAKAASDGTSGASGDERDAVKSAVDGVLKNAGVDLDAFQKDLGTPPAGGPGGPPPSDAASADSSTSATDATASTSGTTSSAFDAYLTSSGIDPDTFKKSLLASLQSGSTDFSGAFSGASVGSSVDLVA